MNKREELLQKLIEVFSNDENTFMIKLYGSDAKETSDEFSDIDIVVYNTDISRLEDELFDKLSEISEVRNYFYWIDGVENQLSPLLWFEDYSPYSRVDLAIVPSIDTYGVNFPGDPNKVVFKDESKKGEITNRKVQPTKHTEHYMNLAINNLVGFCKQYKRGEKGFFRYWQGNVLEFLMYFLKESIDGYPEKEELEHARLNDFGIKYLMKSLDGQSRAQINQIIPEDLKMDFKDSFFKGFDMLSNLLVDRSKHFGKNLDLSVIEYYKNFLKEVGDL